ncbi:probable histone-arginine methyltransferase CARM1 [Telopea speciosissima]|uniref:probable histone-arginine methyltransferase CARM1 n=1 Tax=Telopea speciosissima TaxID=54955 RepID=UPI001CC63236|nr:probable histone-arginine methyltransferase CARM1 [Telopea speciosissima]
MNPAQNNTLPYGRLLTRIFLSLGIDLDREPKGTCTEGPIGFNALQKMNLYYDYDSAGEQVQYGDGRGAREEDEDDSDNDLEFMGSDHLQQFILTFLDRLLCRIHVAPFSDEYLYVEIANKALFWQQQNYYGIDLTHLYGSAFQGYFSQPVVDSFDPRLLVAPAISHTLDFTSVKEEELYEIEIPLSFIASVGTRVHGLACWFDVLFNGSSVQRWLTTAPGAPTTHWYQLRCVLSQPIYVMAGQEITGRLHMVAHNAQSYTMHLTMSAKMWGAGAEQGGILQTSSCKLDLKEPYYRIAQPQAYAWAQDQQSHQLTQSQDALEPGLVQQLSQNSGSSLAR